MNGLTRYDAMRTAIVQAHSIDDVKDIRDKAEALRQYAKQVGESLENQNMMGEIKLRAERRCGELVRDMPKAVGTDYGGRPDLDGNRMLPSIPPPTLSEMGISRMQSSRWQAIADVPEEIFEQHIATVKANAAELTTSSMLRVHEQIRRAEAAERAERERAENAAKVQKVVTLDEVAGTFSTIVIDPPWDWGDEGDVNQFGRAKPRYFTLPFDDILRLPVGKLAAPDAHLYLWITNRSLPKGFELVTAWGFRYVTCVTWAKPYFGMGNYFRGQTEHLLFGVRGSLPLMRRDVGTVFHAPRGPDGHSSKPDEAYTLIESCSPGPYLDMFSRRQRPGWLTWGENGIGA